jgi:hypothetical protein
MSGVDAHLELNGLAGTSVPAYNEYLARERSAN